MNGFQTIIVPTPDGPLPCRVDLYCGNTIVASWHCNRGSARLLETFGEVLNEATSADVRVR